MLTRPLLWCAIALIWGGAVSGLSAEPIEEVEIEPRSSESPKRDEKVEPNANIKAKADIKIEPKTDSASKESPIKDATVGKTRHLPYSSLIAEIDREAGVIVIGKKKKKMLHIRSNTRLRKPDGSTATLEDLEAGMQVRGAYRKIADAEWEAVSVTIGTKADAVEKAKTEEE